MCIKYKTDPKNFIMKGFSNLDSNHGVKTLNTGDYYDIFLNFYNVVLLFLVFWRFHKCK